LWGAFRLAESGQVAEKDLTEIGEDGGAPRGDAVLHKEDGDLTEKSVNAGSGMESREQAQEGGREVLVGGLELEPHMAETKAGGGIEDGKAAAAASGGVVAAATLLRIALARDLVLRILGLGSCLGDWLSEGALAGLPGASSEESSLAFDMALTGLGLLVG